MKKKGGAPEGVPPAAAPPEGACRMGRLSRYMSSQTCEANATGSAGMMPSTSSAWS